MSRWTYDILMVVRPGDRNLADSISATVQGATVEEIGPSFLAQIPAATISPIAPPVVPPAEWLYSSCLMTEDMRQEATQLMQQHNLEAYFYRFLNPHLPPEQKAEILLGMGLNIENLVEGDRILLGSNVPGSALAIGAVVSVGSALADFVAAVA